MFECRAIFISDVHLGCKDCRADYLLSFLQHTQTDKIYLLGDIVDLWAMRSSHTTLQGKKLLLLHGDEFDKDVSFGPLHNWLGDTLYDLLLFLNRWFNRSRRLFGGKYFSLAAYIKRKVPGAQKAIARFRQAVVNKALKGGFDGVVCGHIHHPEIRIEQGIIYCNDGDWIDNCTALVEQMDGSLALYHWTEQAQRLAAMPLQPVASNAKAA